MFHSRPGFAPRRSDSAPAKLNDDMIPALHRVHKQAARSPVKEGGGVDLPKTARELAADAIHEQMVREAQAAAERAGPDILVNPAPSAPPIVLEPGQ